MYIKLILLILILLNSSYLIAANMYSPNSYTKNNFCVVTSQLLKNKGLTVFNTKREFKDICNGKMIFKYKKFKCRWFSMKNMNFNITIGNNETKELFKIGERKEICSTIVIEELLRYK